MFPSRTTGTSIVYGTITPDSPLQITSHMGNNGVIFSDGIEADYLRFNHGSVATIGIAPHKARLVVSTRKEERGLAQGFRSRRFATAKSAL